ncbi:MAG: monofunctional biosynthetic peptidoglycan transglycosylase [Rhizobiaceae bacterium]
MAKRFARNRFAVKITSGEARHCAGEIWPVRQEQPADMRRETRTGRKLGRDDQVAGIGKLRAYGWRGWLRRLIRYGLMLAIAPIILMVLYIPSIIHPVSTLMLKDIVTLKGYDRRWVSIDDVAPALIHSVMMSEDGQFCAHSGVDWAALNQVIDDAMEGEGSRGASTIPMQTVKNLYLWSSRSVIRKAIELPYALAADTIWSKRRLMEIYLNIAEWGPGIYGIEAAAQHHFNTSAKNLTARQSALLAVSLPNPILRNPAKPSRGLTRLARLNERRAAQAGGYVECVTG